MTVAARDQGLRRAQVREHRDQTAIGLHQQHPGAVGGVFGDPQTVGRTLHEARRVETRGDQGIGPSRLPLLDPALGLFGIEQPAIRAAGHPFAFFQAVAQHRQATLQRVVAEQATARQVLDGIEGLAIGGDALDVVAVEQGLALAVAQEKHRQRSAFLADHQAALEHHQAIRLGQLAQYRLALAIGQQPQQAAAATGKFLGHEQAAIGVQGQGADHGDVGGDFPVAPALGRTDRMEMPPGRIGEAAGQHGDAQRQTLAPAQARNTTHGDLSVAER